MGVRIRGWFSQVIEIGWSGDSEAFGEFIRRVNDLGSWVTLLPTTSGGAPLDAMVEGQMEHSHFVRVEAPMSMAAFLLTEIHDIARDCFPGP